jgi:MFS transporter, DHA2 family, multidrug resistance protein
MTSSPVANPSELPIATRVLAFSVMALGMFVALLDIQIVSASLQDIGGGISAGQDETVWVQTAYLIAEIIVIPLAGFLTRVVSTRWLFSFSALGFTLASLMCGIAWNTPSMIAFRAIQGFLGGSMIPTVFTTAFIYFTGRQRIVSAAVIGTIASRAPTLGPAVGGWITDTYSWHWLFFINLVPGVLITVTVPMLVNVDKPDFSLLKKVDYLGIVFLALFLGCLEYVLEEGPRYEWLGDTAVRNCAWISGISFIGFIWRGMTAHDPVVDLRALKDPHFALGCFFSFVAGIGIFGTTYLTPAFLSSVEGYSAFQIGQAVFSIGVFQIMGIPIYTRLAKVVDLRWLLMFGMAMFAVSMWFYTPITHDWSWRELLLPQAFRGFAQMFAVAPAVTLTLGSLPQERLKLASGLFNLMRNLGGAIGIAACATLLVNRTNMHFLHMAEHVNTANQKLMQALPQLSTGHGQPAVLKILFGQTMHEALTQTYSDAFLAISCCFLLATVMVPLMRKVAAPAAASSETH